MVQKKTLVVFHSLTGNTEAAAQAVAEGLGATLERIRPASRDVGKKGFFGIVAGGFRAILRRVDPILPPANDPETFERVIVATPTWGGHVTPALRGWFDTVDRLPAEVALIVTSGGTSARGPVADVTGLLGGRAPDPVLHLTDKDRKSQADIAKIAAFVARLGGAV